MELLFLPGTILGFTILGVLFLKTRFSEPSFQSAKLVHHNHVYVYFVSHNSKRRCILCHILVGVDRLSRYPKAQVCKDCDTKTASSYLEDYCSFHEDYCSKVPPKKVIKMRPSATSNCRYILCHILVSVDRLSRYPSKCRYILCHRLVSVDRLSRYPNAQVCKDCDKKTASSYLEDYCSFHEDYCSIVPPKIFIKIRQSAII